MYSRPLSRSWALTFGARALAATLVLAPQALAQVGDTSGTNYPGWIPSDRVIPVISVAATYSAPTQVWRYEYVLANGTGAQQDILKFGLGFRTSSTAITAPPGWKGTLYDPSAAIPGARFRARLPGTIGTSPNGPAEAQIPPGQSLSGFSITSFYPPGYARTYVRGFAPVPYLPTDFEDITNLPHDTTDSQRGWTLGPTKYTQVLTAGDNQAGVEGFLGFMNLRNTGTTLLNPAPIALKFSLGGETVYRETLKVLLNGLDVTTRFFPGPSDGADLVGVFRLGEVPGLIQGPNVLLTTVEGVSTTNGQRDTDLDRIVFTVQP